MENCCESMVKYFMVFFNILFTLAGCVLIGFGAWSQIAAKDYLNFLGENYVNTPIFLMVVGGIIFIVAFVGCCGACQENRCLIYTYAFLLAVILVAQIGAGIAAYMMKGDLDTEVTKNMKFGMENYKKQDFDGVTHTWDIVQNELHCCGVEANSDWHVNRGGEFALYQYPDSCCKAGIVEGCGKLPNANTTVFDDGCYKLFKTQFVDNIEVIGGVALGVAAVELVIVLFACCLGRRMGLTSQYV